MYFRAQCSICGTQEWFQCQPGVFFSLNREEARAATYLLNSVDCQGRCFMESELGVHCIGNKKHLDKMVHVTRLNALLGRVPGSPLRMMTGAQSSESATVKVTTSTFPKEVYVSLDGTEPDILCCGLPAPTGEAVRLKFGDSMRNMCLRCHAGGCGYRPEEEHAESKIHVQFPEDGYTKYQTIPIDAINQFHPAVA